MLRFAAVVSCALVMAGCASVTRGTTENVQFDSEPSGAEMRSVVEYPCGGPCPTEERGGSGGGAYTDTAIQTPLEYGPACVTPCTAQVRRNQVLIVTFTKLGYEPQTAKLETRVAGGGAVGVAGNVIIGGGIGIVTDAVTGAALDHYPNPMKVTLTPLRQAAPAERPAKRR